MVVCISAGNNGYWAENSQSVAGTLYGDDVNFHTGGSPAHTNSFTVALWITGAIGNCFRVAGKDFVYNETDYTNEPFTSLDTSADGSGTSLDYVFITGVGQAEDYTGIDVAGKVVSAPVAPPPSMRRRKLPWVWGPCHCGLQQSARRHQYGPDRL